VAYDTQTKPNTLWDFKILKNIIRLPGCNYLYSRKPANSFAKNYLDNTSINPLDDCAKNSLDNTSINPLDDCAKNSLDNTSVNLLDNTSVNLLDDCAKNSLVNGEENSSKKTLLVNRSETATSSF